MTETLYTLPLPEATTPTERDSVGTQLAEQGVLGGGAIVEALSGESADLRLTGEFEFGRYYSELLATELSELADSNISGVPLYGGAPQRAGYYEIANADVEPVHSGGRDIQSWDVSLTKVGTRNSQFQAVDTTVTQPAPGTPFGTDETGLVGIPAAARLVQAVDAASNPSQRERPSPTQTVTTEFGDVDLYDVSAVSFADPTYVYDVPKAAQPAVDVSVYDTRGRAQKYIEADGGRVRAWQRVFSRGHEFGEGAVVLSTGALRLRIDEATNADTTATLEAEEYNATDDTWASVSLPDTGWEPADVDITALGPLRVAAQITFESNTDTASTDVYALDIELERGYAAAEVWIPRTETDPVPSGLESLLEPVAATSAIDTGASQQLVERSEVRR